MNKSHEVLRQAIDRVGVKQVAAHLKVSTTLVYKWCQEPAKKHGNPDASGANNPLDRLQKIYEATQDKDLLNWLCSLGDGYFVKNHPEPEDTKLDLNIFKNTQKMVKEFSETLAVIAKAYNKDHQITPEEAIHIRKEWEDLKRISEAFVRAGESGVFERK